jgi:alkaline phosphatase
MAQYIDGFILPIPKARLADYRRVATKAGKIWKEHGALGYFECAGDDMKADPMIPFPKLAKAKEDEVVIFAWAIFKSKAHRDKANKAIMKDERLAAMCGETKGIVNCKRMAYGGFKTIVEL